MITLATDFGSPYPGAIRGALARRTDARLHDVTHDLPAGAVRPAAFWLQFVLPAFPPAVHLAVVDPGTGTDRDVLAVRAGDHALVGPDNGLLWPAARRLAAACDGAGDGDGGEPATPAAYRLARTDEPAAFPARDVVAPLAAAVHAAGPAATASVDGLEPAPEPVDLRLPEPAVDDDGARGEVLAVDGFGNAITNVPGGVLDGRSAVRVAGRTVPVAAAYAAVAPGDPLVTAGDHGNVECAVHRGRGDETFGLEAGDPVELAFTTGA